MLNTPFSPWPSYTNEEVEAVSRVLQSNKVNYWTGTECREFEKEFATFIGTKYAVALANGTVALDLALKALGIGTGDQIIVTPRTFLASVSCVVTVGATPVFADVDNNTQNITAETIAPLITQRTRAVIVVHLAGMPAEMDEIMALSEKHNFYVIEDCAQSHGAKYKGRAVGSIGHVGCWSFCQDKIMTTGGEGGMVTTNSKNLWSTMWSYKDHGKSWEAVYEREHPKGFRWLHESFGTNWRMTEVQAVLGRIQLTLMPDWVRKRQSNAHRLTQVCEQISALYVPQVPNYIEHAFYKYYVFLRLEQLREDWNRDRIVEAIIKEGVPCFQGSCSEVYLEKAFDNTPWRPKNRLPNAQVLGETSLMFLVHPTLLPSEIDKTEQALTKVFNLAIK